MSAARMYPVTNMALTSPARQAPAVLASPTKLAQSVPPLTEVGTQGVPPLNEVGTDGRHVLDIGRGEQAAKPLLRTGPKWVPALRRLCHLPPRLQWGTAQCSPG